MKNIYKIISLLAVVIMMFVLVGCKEPHEHKYENGICECGEVHEELRIDYFNNNLKNTSYKSSNYSKKLELSGSTLLEETTTSNFNGSVYNITSIIKKLNDKGELEESTLTKEDTEPTEISLELKKEYFSEIKMNENTLEGKINEASSQAFIGVSASNIEIKITLTDDLKVSNITIKYIDSQTNINVSILVSYNY